jgi:hypothetical protein
MSSAAVAYPSDIDEIVFDEDRATDEAKQREGFRIGSQDKATWAARRYLQAEKRITERERLAKEYKARIDSWLEHANKGDLDTTETMRTLLTPFLEHELSGSTRKRSIDLLGVRVGFRKLPERVEIVDTSMALDFCEANHPEVVIVKKELSKAALRKAAHHGALIPGVVLDGGQDRLVVTELEAE